MSDEFDDLEAPQNLSGSCLEPDNRIIISWERPHTLQTCFFRVFMKETNNSKWNSQKVNEDINEELKFETGALKPLSSYDFKVQSYNNLKQNGRYIITTVQTGEARPATGPVNLRETRVEISEIKVTWDPPLVPNGTITGYILDYDELGSEEYTQKEFAANELEYEMINLKAGTEYRFQVSSHNKCGEGPPSSILVVKTLQNARRRFRPANGSDAELKQVPEHKVRSIRGVVLTPEEPTVIEPELNELPVVKPKGVWKPRKRETPPPPEPKEIKPRTNPEAMGAKVSIRRKSMEQAHSSAVEANAVEADMRAFSLKSTREINSGGQLTEGAGAVKLLGRGPSKRDHWSSQLKKDPVNMASDLELNEAYRLLNQGRELKNVTGTIRGKKNAVRKKLGLFNGNDSGFKSELHQRLYHAEKDNKIVIYISSLEAIRTTRDNCARLLQIFEILNVKIQVKDIHLDPLFAKELTQRVDEAVVVPQVFINAVHIGGLDDVIRMNDAGDLQRAIADFETRSNTTCGDCGGIGYVPCSWCQGSRKSRSHQFNSDPRKNALKCTVCNENGLQRCRKCPE
eukprot:m.56401 g.56401  ORF g.56401 m.56401 type:complete len:570 (-) comp11037_c0_seq2:84-1793(-)